MIRLFLNNKEVELNSSVSFAINKQFEDITSPADIKNDWSKTVQIPFSQSNNKLFGELFKVDRLIVEGDSTLMGIYFDPYKKVDFRLQWGDAIIMQGYAKNIDVVKSANGEGHYNITLNACLGFMIHLTLPPYNVRISKFKGLTVNVYSLLFSIKKLCSEFNISVPSIVVQKP